MQEHRETDNGMGELAWDAWMQSKLVVCRCTLCMATCKTGAVQEQGEGTCYAVCRKTLGRTGANRLELEEVWLSFRARNRAT